MKLLQLTFCTLLFAATTVHAFELSDISDRLFEDNATGIF